MVTQMNNQTIRFKKEAILHSSAIRFEPIVKETDQTKKTTAEARSDAISQMIEEARAA